VSLNFDVGHEDTARDERAGRNPKAEVEAGDRV